MAVNFKDLLGKRADQAEKPKPIPAGTYFGQITKWEATESSQKKTPGVKIHFNLTGADQDVNEDELQEAGGLAAVQKRKVSTTFWLTEDSEYRLREFLEGPCKLETAERSYAELLAEIVNLPVRVVLEQRLTDKKEVYMDVSDVLVAD